MKWRFTIKEFTLLAGILVALLVVLTLWLNPTESASLDQPTQSIPQTIIPSAKITFEKILQLSLDYADLLVR